VELSLEFLLRWCLKQEDEDVKSFSFWRKKDKISSVVLSQLHGTNFDTLFKNLPVSFGSQGGSRTLYFKSTHVSLIHHPKSNRYSFGQLFFASYDMWLQGKAMLVHCFVDRSLIAQVLENLEIGFFETQAIDFQVLEEQSCS
jgi:hypothetical protein